MAGGIAGTVLANLMFDLSAVNISTHHRTGGGIWLGEVVATFGLLLVIFGVARSGRVGQTAYAVAGYILAAYWFTSSTSFANPAVTVARMFSNSFAGISPASVAMFVLMQLLGGVLGYTAIRVLYPNADALAAQLTAEPGGQPPPPLRRRRLSPSDPRGRPRLMSDKPAVLFVCVHNAGRSQMAAGFARHLGGDRIEVRSAGSEPRDVVNPTAVAAMAELGIDISDQVPKKLTVEAVEASTTVITMGCGDVCPVFPGTTYRDWALPDPAGQDIEAVRPIRDEIRRRIVALLAELLPAAARRTGGYRPVVGAPLASAPAKASSALSTTRKYAHLPRCSRVISPASSSCLRWWETVGCDSPSGAVRSQTHAPSPFAAAWAAIRETSRTRLGSPSALNTRARRSAVAGSIALAVTGAQHEAKSSTRGRLVRTVMSPVCHPY